MPYGVITEIIVTKCPDCGAAIGYPIHAEHTAECPRIKFPKTRSELWNDVARAAIQVDQQHLAGPQFDGLRQAIESYQDAERRVMEA